MEIVEAQLNDLTEIVEVLKASLGEKDLPLSKEIWNYKHIHNPFGSSLVLLAKENAQIIGVRAFMRWQWQLKEKKYSALRAVDTATHPEHQGKGIFKKLTLQAVELSKNCGDNFIFNTPNDQSRPGYLKMGWKKADKLKVGIKPNFHFPFSNSSGEIDYKIKKEVTTSKLEDLCDHWNNFFISKNNLFTPKSTDFLEWRYEKNPLQKYNVVATNDFYIAAYIKTRGKFKELRIAECIVGKNNKMVRKEIKNCVNEMHSRFGSHFLSFSPMTSKFNPALKGKFGPMLTLRELELTGNKDLIFNLENWRYSIGDLELF